MTSLLDQYEQTSQRTMGLTAPSSPAGPEVKPASGFINMAVEDETPMFYKQKVNFAPPDKIIHMCVSSELIVLAMANGILFRIDLKAPDKPEEIDFSKLCPQLRLSGMFLDPTGDHLLLSFVPRNPESGLQAELFYLNRKSTKIRPATRFRGHEITAVGWNHENVKSDTTKPLLLGTSKGLILETALSNDSERIFQSSIEQYFKQLPNYLPLYGQKEVEGMVFDIGKGNSPITGLEFHRLPNRERYFIIATTPNRIYQFVGNVNSSEDRPLLQQIFNVYLSKAEGFIEVPSQKVLKYSKLQFFYPKSSQQKPVLPSSFAWLTEESIFYGQVDISGEGEEVLSDSQRLNYPASAPAPLNFVLTEFHVLLLYPNKVVGLSILNQSMVFEDLYNESYGRLVTITKDPTKGTVWVIAERTVYRYKISREDRNVWQIYMEKGQFDLAKEYCGTNQAYLDQVLNREAETHFNNQEYELSAERYAETHSSFEEIALKFLQVWQIKALKTFLQKKLEKLRPSDQTQTTMIVIWVIELFMNEMGTLRSQGMEHSNEYQQLQQDLDRFLALRQVEECVKRNKGTVYDLMASHGDKQSMIRLTIANKDFERVVQQHIHKGDFYKALDVLRKQKDKSLFYTFTPALVQAVPKAMVQALIEQGRALDPTKLLPALVTCHADENQANEIIRYLEFCVSSMNVQEQAVHNYLLTLYAQHKPDRLMRYLAMQGQEVSMVNYDVHYALRLCRERGLTQACVQLSALLGLWQSAVDLALSISVDLAKQTASMPTGDDELTKKLWLKIAQHVVSKDNDIQQAMQFLKECDLIKIEDILPFFSDFVTIDHFKEAICSALQEYNQHIQDLREEMEDATKSADVIRQEIQSFRTRYTVLEPGDACAVCDIRLILRPFYVFPCGHRFHADCLVTELKQHLSQQTQNELRDLQKKLANLCATATDTTSAGTASLLGREQVKTDIDTIVASECLYCGDYMINALDQPFIKDEDYDRITKEWE
ncbi:vacuolar protein sorting-associated protein 18 homolog isoform X1 [Macrosteles quadrilineatus]|uniref:vacuolar protein sorting-associated protein 18 homolog isoform X1 n=1 Tax=Macrosteles quadrilineatus TaxID=74068 RepID=UPI0023E0BE5A|nr:vacuolar protein sorting-associated protein 18 homolog isoform X1 [Macrosteles quadrilineatus]